MSHPPKHQAERRARFKPSLPDFDFVFSQVAVSFRSSSSRPDCRTIVSVIFPFLFCALFNVHRFVSFGLMHKGGRGGPPPRRGYQGPRYYCENNQEADSAEADFEGGPSGRISWISRWTDLRSPCILPLRYDDIVLVFQLKLS